MRSQRTVPDGGRRRAIAMLGAVAGGGLMVPLLVRPARATPERMREAIEKLVGKAEVRTGRIKLEIAPYSENGNSVACAATVESPMTPADHVTSIHIFNEKNPQPEVIAAHIGPRAGRATFSTRIRLSDTQTVVAIARLSDGSFWSDSANVIVTLGACLEES